MKCQCETTDRSLKIVETRKIEKEGLLLTGFKRGICINAHTRVFKTSGLYLDDLHGN